MQYHKQYIDEITRADQLFRKGDFKASKAALLSLKSKGYDNFDTNYALASVEFAEYHYQSALEYFEHTLALAGEQEQAYKAQILFNIARCYEILDEPQASLEKYQQILELENNNVLAWYGSGQVYTVLGKAELALSAYQKVIQNSDISTQPYERSMSFLAISQISSFDAEASALVQADIDKSISSSTRANLLFALANASEKKQDFDMAFNFFRQANDIKATECNFDPIVVDSHANEIIQFFTKEVWDSLSSNRQSVAQPIFIVGLPRTGTTLVESILSCCDLINPCGEVSYLPEIIQKMTAGHSSNQPYPHLVCELSQTDLEAFAEFYLSSTGNNAKAISIDKLPANFWHIGLIKLLFPQAKIINCNKNPLDTCLSLFKQSFQEGHAYSYQLDHCADYFEIYQKLMAHWHQLFPEQIFELSYESLVSNSEQVCRELYRYCGLEWKDSYLDGHVKRGNVKTGSALQIRSKINKSSLNRWKRYSRHLAELKSRLKLQS